MYVCVKKMVIERMNVIRRESRGGGRGEEVEVPFIRISYILLPKSWSRRGRPNAGRKLGGESARKGLAPCDSPPSRGRRRWGGLTLLVKEQARAGGVEGRRV